MSTLHILTPGEALVLTGRTRRACPIPQLGPGPNGAERGVMLQALSVEDRMAAQSASIREVRRGVWEVNEWWQACEEVARGIYDPPNLPASVIATWNEAVVRFVHQELQLTAFLVAERAAGARTDAMGGPPPPPPAPAAAARARPPRVAPAGDVGAGDSSPAPDTDSGYLPTE